MKLSEQQQLLLVDFMTFCTTRDKVATLASKHESAVGLELVDEYANVLLDYDFENVDSYLNYYYNNEK